MDCIGRFARRPSDREIVSQLDRFCEQMESSEWDERDGRLRHEGMWSSAAGVAEIQLIARKGLPA
jgi:hypothetical protein